MDGCEKGGKLVKDVRGQDELAGVGGRKGYTASRRGTEVRKELVQRRGYDIEVKGETRIAQLPLQPE